ncbi:MAG TPA: nucleotidyltransferase family protein [Mycobacteriales bacterium]|jgi:nicotine blue oxidoreductase
MRVAGLVLAAGGGSRYGAPKALVRLRGRLLVERAADLLAAGGCDPVVVVLGAAADEVLATARLQRTLVRTVVNPDWPTGMGSSLQVGLAALPPEADAVVVALVDTPGLGPESVRRLVAAGGPDGAAQATYGGRRGHPVLLGRTVITEVAAAATGDRGAGPWLAAHPERVRLVPCDGTGDPRDVDVPDDLAAVVAGEE